MAKRKTKKKKTTKKSVETLKHDDASRKNIPTAEFQSVVEKNVQQPVPVTYPRNSDRPGGAASAAMVDETDNRNPDLDPQLIWRGKSTDPLDVAAPALYIQEKVHPKALIDDLRRQTEAAEIARKQAAGEAGDIAEQLDLFADFNGIPDHAQAKTEFYQHDAHWSNRMILGDSLAVMASLAEREGLRGQVQCIYLDPPYGIKFNSNFQWSTTSRDVKDGKADHITREPEQVKAFRDTWRDGIHSYLTYLRDRLTVARDLLHDTGSIFVQIGDENVHRVRALLDEVFGDDQFCAEICFKTSSGFETSLLSTVFDQVLWYAKDKSKTKYRQLFSIKGIGSDTYYDAVQLADGTRQKIGQDGSYPEGARPLFRQPLISSGESPILSYKFHYLGRDFRCGSNRHWKSSEVGLGRLAMANRIHASAKSLKFIRFHDDYPVSTLDNIWSDTVSLISKQYVVETNPKVIERCLLMATDPGDLVLDPTCGSGTTAYVAEQWGRRWITIDTSRVSLALARARIMGARYPYYLLADSPEGRKKEAELTRTQLPEEKPLPHGRGSSGNVRQGFVYERVPHITLKSIANNAEIDVIYEKFQQRLEPLREKLNELMGTAWEQWEVPRDWNEALRQSGKGFGESGAGIPASHEGKTAGNTGETAGNAGKTAGNTGKTAGNAGKTAGNAGKTSLREGKTSLREGKTSLREGKTGAKQGRTVSGGEFAPPSAAERAARDVHTRWWEQRIQRQKEIDASIAAKADFEYLYDKPYEDRKTVRVAGPFTVESISPHRVLGVGADDELLDPLKPKQTGEPDSSGVSPNGEDAFVKMVLENLKTAGVQQAHKEDKLTFTTIKPWPGHYIGAEGRYVEVPRNDDIDDADEQPEKRAAIFIGPEFGTVSRQQLVLAAREAGDADFDVLIACAFNYEAHASEFDKLGRIPVLKARMNADLHMADDLKNTGKGNLFVIFGEPDIDLLPPPPEEGDDHNSDPADGPGPYDLGEYSTMRVRINGVDVFHPATGEVRSDDADGIACWFIDTDYNEESFFVRQAYFLGANDPYKSLKTTLKAEIDKDAWESLHSDTSREFPKPKGGRIAVKVINHLGDEVMKVFRVE